MYQTPVPSPAVFEYGVELTGGSSHAENSLLNSGVISGHLAGVRIVSSRDSTVFNSGIIAGGSEGGIVVDTSNIVLTNVGSIIASVVPSSGAAISLEYHIVGAGVRAYSIIANEGTISAPVTAIEVASARVQINNDGRIIGDIRLDDFGVFNDVYEGEGGTVVGLIDMGAGDDQVTGGASREKIQGGRGNDEVLGGGGDDVFRANGDGGATPVLRDGDDLFDGGAGRDTYDGLSETQTTQMNLEEGRARDRPGLARTC